MKKQILGAAVSAVFGIFAATSAMAAPAESTILWSGTIPGGFAGSDIGLASPSGGLIQQGQVSANEDGTFASTIVPVRAFALDGVTGEVDPTTTYPNAINWWVANRAIQHNGVAGNAYDTGNLVVQVNGTTVADNEQVTTAAGSPDALIQVSYTSAPTGVVTANDSISVRTTLFAEGDVGAPL